MIGTGSVVVNGQLIPIPTGQSYDPLTFGQAYTGPAMWPRQGVYNVPAVVPAGSLQSSMAPAAYGSSGQPLPTTHPNPLHPTKSPLVFALIFLGAGILMLQYIHYK